MRRHLLLIVTILTTLIQARAAMGSPPAQVKNTEKQTKSSEKQAAQQKKATDKAGEVATLRQAYGTLSTADHDYQGHRIRAMHAIEAACKLLGTEISGDGRNREKQSVSDGQLRAALSQVAGVRATAAADNQPRLVQHLDVAIKELNIALSIK